jgi:hypothetical protein
MNARRFRKDSTQRLTEFRWWGCVLLAMFAVVQTARGSTAPPPCPEPIRSCGTQLPPGSVAASDRGTYVVSVDASISVAAWDQAPPGAAQETY